MYVSRSGGGLPMGEPCIMSYEVWEQARAMHQTKSEVTIREHLRGMMSFHPFTTNGPAILFFGFSWYD